MVLSLKTWKSRSLPGLPRTDYSSSRYTIRESANARSREAQSEFKKAAMAKTMAAFLFYGVRLSGTLAIRSRSRLFTGNESDKAGKHDSIRCDRVNVDIR
jgi:hypothetical protein